MPQSKRYLGIGTKTVVMVCALVVVSSGAVGYFTYRRFSEVLIQRELGDLSTLAQVTGSRFIADATALRDSVTVLSKLQVIKWLMRAQAAGGKDPETGLTEDELRQNLAGIFADVCRAKPEYSKIRLIGAADNAHEIVRVDRFGIDGSVRIVPDEELQPKADRPFVRRGLATPVGQVYLSELDLDQDHGKFIEPHIPVIRAATVIPNPDGTPFAVVVINRRMPPLFDELQRLIQPGQELYICNERGDFLVCPDPAKAFGFQLGQAIRIQDEYPKLADTLANPAIDSAAVVEQAAHGERVAVGLNKTHFDPERPERFFAFAIAEPYDYIVDASVDTRNRSILVALAVLLPALAIGYGLSRTLAKPLQQIAAGANAFARGETDIMLPVGASDEAGVVARALDNMISQVRARRIELEREVAERQRAERLAREQSARIQTIVDSVVDAVITIDSDGIVDSFNTSAEKMFGYAADEVIGKNVGLLMPSPYREEHGQYLRNYLETGVNRIIGIGREVTALRRDGTVFPVELSVGEVKIGDRRLFTGIVKDISRRKQWEQQLKDAHDELARRTAEVERFNAKLATSNEELKQFAYVASHDLQEPLRKVTLFCQMLRDEYSDRLDDEGKKYIDFAVDGAQRMRSMVADLLTYSRVETQGKPLSPTDAGSAFAEAVDNLEIAIREASATIECDSLPTVKADRAQLVRLFQNLLANSIKFRGKDAPRIEVWAEDAGDEWIFHVSDNGIGIEPQYHQRIFVIFQRLHAREACPGTGIGLAVCQRIVDRMDGRIWVESQLGRGSDFCFAVPKLPSSPFTPTDEDHDVERMSPQIAGQSE